MFQRGEAKLLTEDWEGAVNDLKSAAQKSPQVSHDRSSCNIFPVITLSFVIILWPLLQFYVFILIV